MRPIVCAFLGILTLWNTQAIAADKDDNDTFQDLLVEPETSLAARCHNGIVLYRSALWKNSNRPQVGKAFETVEEMMQDLRPKDLKDLEAMGCNPRYIHGCMSCTQLDRLDAAHIVPTGVTAKTDAEMALIMATCLRIIPVLDVVPVR